MAKRRRRRKLSDDQIKRARILILRGRSLRSIARVYKVHHSSLSARLVTLYGQDYRKPDRTAEILAEYAGSNDPRIAAAAQEFLSQYEPSQTADNFYTSRQELNCTIRASHYTLNPDTFRASWGGVSCKVA